MQTLFISERSFIAQASSRHHATALLTTLAHILKALRPRLAPEQPFRVHTDLGHAKLTSDLTLRDWLAQKPSDRATHEVHSLLWRLLNAGPFFNIEESDAQSATLARYRLPGTTLDVTDSAAASAGAKRAWLASLEQANVFSAHPLSIERHEPPPIELFDIPNFSTLRQVEALKLVYSPNDKKHHPNSTGERAPMDLSPLAAEELLNCSIQADGKKQRYAVAEDTVYEFQPDGTGAYHGYRVEREQELMEVPLDVRERLGRIRH